MIDEKLTTTGVPVLVWGPPGIGKSAAIHALGRRLGLPVETVVASVREPADFSGLPIVVDGGVRLAPPAWAQRLAQAGRGILFLDEISTAPPAVQAALLRVVLDRVVGDLPLPPQVTIIAAANPPEMAAGGWDLTPPLANRFIHLRWQVDAREWAQEFPSYWGNPPQLPGLEEPTWARARALVAGFISARPHLLLQVPREAEAQGRAWPSPRSWDHASRALAAYDLDATAAAEAVAGCVGEGPALEFLAWVRAMDLPDPEELLQDPGRYQHPARGDQAFAILSAVVAAVQSHPTEARWTASWDIISRAVAAGGPDVAAAAARGLARLRQPSWRVPVEEIRVLAPVLKGAGLM